MLAFILARKGRCLFLWFSTSVVSRSTPSKRPRARDLSAFFMIEDKQSFNDKGLGLQMPLPKHPDSVECLSQSQLCVNLSCSSTTENLNWPNSFRSLIDLRASLMRSRLSQEQAFCFSDDPHQTRKALPHCDFEKLLWTELISETGVVVFPG